MRPIDITLGSDRPARAAAGPFRVSTGRFRPGLRIESHVHEWACVSVILDGRFEQRFPGQTVDCLPGAVLAKPPFERHADRWFEAWTRHLMIEIDPARHHELGDSQVVAEEVKWLNEVDLHPITLAITRELVRQDSVTPLAVEGLVLQLLAAIRRADERSVRGDWPGWLDTARDYIHDNFRRGLRLGDVAEAAGVHPDTLSRMFPAAFSTNFGTYVRKLRVEAAAELLRTTERPISSIALGVGFADQSHLTRVFKSEMGLPPGAYRAATRSDS